MSSLSDAEIPSRLSVRPYSGAERDVVHRTGVRFLDRTFVQFAHNLVGRDAESSSILKSSSGTLPGVWGEPENPEGATLRTRASRFGPGVNVGQALPGEETCGFAPDAVTL